jgi:dynactin complex subunit
MRGNKTDYEDLVMRIVELLDPIRKALENQNSIDIDLSLKEDLERFTQYVPSF